MKSRRVPLATINITPLVDVLLILLVVVMLAMPLFVRRLPVELPATSVAGAPVVSHSMSVSLQADGRLALNGSPTAWDVLAPLITPEVTVELSIDRSVTYDRIAELVADIQEKGPKEIVLITR